MWQSVDATEVDKVPIEGYRKYIFVPMTLVIIFVICLLFLNLFVGVVIETFNTQQELLTNNRLLSTDQKTYLKVHLLTFTVEPKVNPNPKSSNCFVQATININNSHKFELFIVVAILLNAIVLGFHHYTISKELEGILEGLNLTFMFIFVVEAIIKITAMKRAYFRDRWN